MIPNKKLKIIFRIVKKNKMMEIYNFYIHFSKVNLLFNKLDRK